MSTQNKWEVTHEILGPDNNGTYGTNVYVRGMHIGGYMAHPEHDKDDSYVKEVNARANLVCAAPELLEALLQVQQWRKDAGNEAIPYVEAAIAKATGGQS